MQKILDHFLTRLRQAAGGNLKSMVLYGSAAAGEFHPKHSDINLLCILDRLGADELEALNPAVAWWARNSQPSPVIFTVESLRRSAVYFPIEFLDIKASRRVLFGEDFFDQLDVPLDRHRAQLERELRINLIRLQKGYLVAARDHRAMKRLMSESLPSFATLFRHALLDLGDDVPKTRQEAVDRLAAKIGFDARPFHAILEMREGKVKADRLDTAATFRGVLAAVEKIVEAFDRGAGA